MILVYGQESLHGFQMLFGSCLLPKQSSARSLEPPSPNHKATLRIPAWTCIFLCNVMRRSILVSYLRFPYQRQPGVTYSSSSSLEMKGSCGPQDGKSYQPLFCLLRPKHKQPSTEHTDSPATNTIVGYLWTNHIRRLLLLTHLSLRNKTTLELLCLISVDV